MKYSAGEVFKVDFPFHLASKIFSPTGHGLFDDGKWNPGCRGEPVYPDDSELVADGIGKMIVTIVDSFKPAHYPVRVFYTRKWCDPDGKEFGSNALHIKTEGWLTRRLSGYHHPFRLETPEHAELLRKANKS